MAKPDYGLGVKSEDIPAVFDAKLLADIFQCHITTAYDIMKRPGFPVFRQSERRLKIYKVPFLAWLERETGLSSGAPAATTTSTT